MVPDLENIAELESVEDRAKSIVVTTINGARNRLGLKLTLDELAMTAATFWSDHSDLPPISIETPIPATAEKFLSEAIENYWKLSNVFKYSIKYVNMSSDEESAYYYFEAIFSQPTAEYPIAQATASVFFRVEDQLAMKGKAPLVYFRIEGDYTDHDIRILAPVADWILALIQKKIKFFKRLETMNIF